MIDLRLGVKIVQIREYILRTHDQLHRVVEGMRADSVQCVIDNLFTQAVRNQHAFRIGVADIRVADQSAGANEQRGNALAALDFFQIDHNIHRFVTLCLEYRVRGLQRQIHRQEHDMGDKASNRCKQRCFFPLQAAAAAAFKQAGDDHIGIAIFEHTRVQDDFYQTVADDHAVIRPHGGQHLADSPKVSFFVQRAQQVLDLARFKLIDLAQKRRFEADRVALAAQKTVLKVNALDGFQITWQCRQGGHADHTVSWLQRAFSVKVLGDFLDNARKQSAALCIRIVQLTAFSDNLIYFFFDFFLVVFADTADLQETVPLHRNAINGDAQLPTLEFLSIIDFPCGNRQAPLWLQRTLRSCIFHGINSLIFSLFSFFCVNPSKKQQNAFSLSSSILYLSPLSRSLTHFWFYKIGSEPFLVQFIVLKNR